MKINDDVRSGDEYSYNISILQTIHNDPSIYINTLYIMRNKRSIQNVSDKYMCMQKKQAP